MTDYTQLSDDQINRMVTEMLGKCIIVGGVTITAQKIPDYLHDPVALEDVKRWVEGQAPCWKMTYTKNNYELLVDNNEYLVILSSGKQPIESRAWCIAALMLKEAQK